jgi:hypothetical protein
MLTPQLLPPLFLLPLPRLLLLLLLRRQARQCLSWLQHC